MAKRKPIPLEKFLEQFGSSILQYSKTEHPLAFALVGAALLENALMTLLHRYLVEGPTTEGLFGIQGTLGSYSECARMAYCLGLIPKNMLANLERIGQIRNKFAHSTSERTFHDPEIAAICHTLTTTKATPDLLPDTDLSQKKLASWKKKSPADKYGLTCGLLLEHLHALMQSVQRLQLSIEVFDWY
jgi:DNA-binding MltR family transcriptional regulator